MRRRSDRKKSSDVCALATSRRSSRRSKKSPSMRKINDQDSKMLKISVGLLEQARVLSECNENDSTSQSEADKEGDTDYMTSVHSVKSDEDVKVATKTSETVLKECSLEMQHGNNVKIEKTDSFELCECSGTDVGLKENIALEENKSNLNKDLVIKSSDSIADLSVALPKDELDAEAFIIASDLSKMRKRKWITKKPTESLYPILSISTDSLRNLISDVQPVPLSDIQLDSSSDVEEINTEREQSVESLTKTTKLFDSNEKPCLEKENLVLNTSCSTKFGNVICTTIRSPSPSINQESNILYITNLVRPFTILQLKGLLARTGKIVNDGFWIDRIKSKCYVQYEAEDEAIETRHALHGIRWPSSNPKCLNVDFGKKDDMRRAIMLTEDLNKHNQDNGQDNSNINSFLKSDMKIRPVREWDVGKHNNLDGERQGEDNKTRSSRQKERELVKGFEGDKNDKKHKYRYDDPSISLSPVRKQKTKESDPPLRLLDDLFRKTHTTPCIYWLPLTPEQISEKEISRKKRFDDQKQRITERREMERVKAFARGTERYHEKNRERKKAHIIDDSNDSRDKHRY